MLSEHFSLDELTRSDAATRLGITEQFNPSHDVSECLSLLCKAILEPLRTALGEPIHITSGYRCEKVNKKIGGAKNSQHVLGQAVDIHVKGLSIEDLYQFIRNLRLPVDQCIQEFDTWVHVSYNAFGTNRNQFLRAVKENGKTIYKKDD
jgi:zinc D-Ala-D-Ala carboxypeptidase